METLGDPFVALVILTNLGYLLPTIVSWSLGVYDVAAAHVAVSAISSIHHLCYDGGLCSPEIMAAMQLVDIALAQYAISRSVIFLVNYDLIRVGKRYELVRHTYADFAQVIYDALIFGCVILFGNSLISSVVLGIYAIIVIALSVVIYWRIKKETFTKRFNWKILLAFAFGALGVVLFVMEERIGRVFHSLWHVCGGLTSFFALLGASGHMAWKPWPFFGALFGNTTPNKAGK